MRYFDELQNKLISYWDALAEGDSAEIDVEGLEADLLAHRPGGYLGIYQGITDLIQAARHIRNQSSDYDYFDFLPLEEDVQALYYLMSIADQGSGSSVVEVPVVQTPRPSKTASPSKTEEQHKNEAEKVIPREEIKIAAMSKGTRYIFENNPYCVLGISCSSTRSEVLKVRDKLQKLSHLNAAHTYTTDFDLSFVEKPNRELGRIQVILENVTDMSHRWLWFKEASYYSKAWDALNIYREENSAFNYDMDAVEKKLKETKFTLDTLKNKGIDVHSYMDEYNEINNDFDKYYDLVDVDNDQVELYSVSTKCSQFLRNC